MGIFKKKDPLPLFISGKINEYKLNKRLEKLRPDDVTNFDLEKWRDFILEKNEIVSGHSRILIYLEKMIALIKRDDLLVDIATKGYGDDNISIEALRSISEQDSLQMVLEAFNRKSPLHSYSEFQGRFRQDCLSWAAPKIRGAELMYVLLKRIDAEHFKAALKNCDGKMEWLDSIRSVRFNDWRFIVHEGKKSNKYKCDDIYILAKERGLLE